MPPGPASNGARIAVLHRPRGRLARRRFAQPGPSEAMSVRQVLRVTACRGSPRQKHRSRFDPRAVARGWSHGASSSSASSERRSRPTRSSRPSLVPDDLPEASGVRKGRRAQRHGHLDRQLPGDEGRRRDSGSPGIRCANPHSGDSCRGDDQRRVDDHPMRSSTSSHVSSRRRSNPSPTTARPRAIEGTPRAFLLDRLVERSVR